MVPFGENPSDHTEPMGPVRVRSFRPVVVSHSRIVPSPDPAAIMVPFGENPTDRAVPV